MGKKHILRDPIQERDYDLDKLCEEREVLTVGRGNCDISVPNTELFRRVSGHSNPHAIIFNSGDRFIFTDSSRHGTEFPEGLLRDDSKTLDDRDEFYLAGKQGYGPFIYEELD